MEEQKIELCRIFLFLNKEEGKGENAYGFELSNNYIKFTTLVNALLISTNIALKHLKKEDPNNISDWGLKILEILESQVSKGD